MSNRKAVVMVSIENIDRAIEMASALAVTLRSVRDSLGVQQPRPKGMRMTEPVASAARAQSEEVVRVPRFRRVLSEKQKEAIRSEWDSGHATQVGMAKAYGVSPTTIARVLYGNNLYRKSVSK